MEALGVYAITRLWLPLILKIGLRSIKKKRNGRCTRGARYTPAPYGAGTYPADG